jgi:predicted dehydrogenase
MALDLTPEQREIGKANFQRVTDGLTRRDFMKSMAMTGGVVLPVSAAVYFGYKQMEGKPVRAALIGGGDEGGVLIGEHNPEFLHFVAVADIRPSNMSRIFEGDPAVPIRKGFKKIYGGEAAQIKKYTDYKEMLAKEKDIEAVVIAVPLHLHAPVAIDCLNAGKHVLCEKLMGWNITQCKEMIAAAKKNNRILSIGHQRHYSMLYAHAHEVMEAGVLGDVKMIRALWHRNNSWPRLEKTKDGKEVPVIDPITGAPLLRDGWCPLIPKEDADALTAELLKKYGYKSIQELVRWRLYNRTGGGLMAELGSHQLDACSIFLGKVHPLSVQGVGGKFFYGPGKNDRESDDTVAVTYEFPGRNHPRGAQKGNDPNDVVVVTYSSINTNGFEAYGECVMGSRGTMVVEAEANVMLYTERDPNKKQPAGPPKSLAVGVDTTGGGKPALDASSTYGPPVAANAAGGAGPAGAAGGPPSRGYREEMEDFAYCIRLWDEKLGYETDSQGKFKQRLPRCHGKVAMADAIVALTANLAMKGRSRIEFKEEWFDPQSPAVPDADLKPEIV